MRIAVTGGAGFIGAHVVDRLVAAGHDVLVLDPIAPHRSDVAHRQIDIPDLTAWSPPPQGCDALFHLAAVSNVNDVYDAPVDAVGATSSAPRTSGRPPAETTSAGPCWRARSGSTTAPRATSR